MPKPKSEVHVALLRGVNVGGNNRLSMKDLTAMFEAAGCTQVRTYIQSGNVVFAATPAVAKRLRKALATALEDCLGRSVPVVLRTAAEMEALGRDNPFHASGADPSTLCVGFLADPPTDAGLAKLDRGRSATDEFEVRGSEIFLRYPLGLAKSKLTNAYFDKALGTACTVRNWRTVQALTSMAAEASAR